MLGGHGTTCVHTPKAKKNMNPTPLPTREEIALLELFPSLGLRDIDVVSTPAQAAAALVSLRQHQVLGFDTESRPTFLRNETSTGPHTLQLASLDHAWVFQLLDAACRAAAAELLASTSLVKVGFGLSGDRTQIRRTLGIEPEAVVDLDTVFRRRGYRREVGVKTAVALVFRQRFVKSRKQTTSNWAARQLTEAQVCYAANDAYAAMCVADALGVGTAVK